MKRFISLFLSCYLILLFFSGCARKGPAPITSIPSASSETEILPEEPQVEATPDAAVQESGNDVPYMPVDIRVAVLKGSTGMSCAKLMSDAAAGSCFNNYQFSLSSDASDVMAKLISGEYDIAALPTNSAAVAFNKSQGEVQMLAINTLGVLYLMQRTGVDGSPIREFEELRGKTIVAFGQGANPEYVLNYLLTQNGLTPGIDVFIDWKASVDEVLTAVVLGDYEFVMLPEPNVTVANSKNSDYTICMDLTQKWEDVSDGSLVMGCMAVSRTFAAANSAAVEKFLEEYKASIDFITSDSAAPTVIAAQEIVPSETIAQAALPNCHIVCVTGAEMQQLIDPYYQMLFEANPKAVGGSIPSDEFYYVGE